MTAGRKWDGVAAGTDEAFDAQARALHARALASVSPSTRAAIRRARQGLSTPAVRERTSRGALGWVLGAAFAAVLAVVVGTQLAPPAGAPVAGTVAVGAVPTAPGANATATATADDDATAVAAQDDAAPNGTYTALDEDPDLYLWMASGDAPLVAME